MFCSSFLTIIQTDNFTFCWCGAPALFLSILSSLLLCFFVG
jgi:hypothetical protein